MENKTKLLVAIPHMGTFPEPFVTSLLGLYSRCNLYVDLEVGVKFVGNTLIHQAREDFIEYALEEDFNYVLFLDSDMTFPSDVIEQLIKHQVDVISGLYFMRILPHYPTAYIWKEEKGQFGFAPLNSFHYELMEIDACGCGCLLINLNIFKSGKIEKPYFAPIPSNSGKTVLSEDLAFCKKLTDAGYKIILNTNVRCGHVGSYIYTEDDFQEANKA